MLSTLICLLSVKSDLIEVIEGDLPIVITAPHGGILPIPGAEERKDTTLPQFVTVLDTRTDELARATSAQIRRDTLKHPWVIIAKFSRKFADANRPSKVGTESEAAKLVHDEYHAAIRKAVDAVRAKFGTGILVDIHGQGSDKDVVFRGTQNLKTVKGLSDDTLFGKKSFLGMLENSGIKIFPTNVKGHDKENPKFDGGYTVQTYGLGHQDGITAIQLEFGGSYRSVKSIPETAMKLAKALDSDLIP